VAENKFVALGFFKDAESKEAKAYSEAANGIEDVVCAVTSSEAVSYSVPCFNSAIVVQQVFKLFNVQDDAAVIVLKKFDDLR
jgi:hypothetical protein